MGLVIFIYGREFFGVADVVFGAYGVEELFLVHENEFYGGVIGFGQFFS